MRINSYIYYLIYVYMNVEEQLTIDFGQTNHANNPFFASGATTTLVDSSPFIPWKSVRHRMPWTQIPEKLIKGMNFFFTINPDPDIDYYENTKAFLIPKMLNLLDKLKSDRLILKSIIVYEWGKSGASHGKLHFHGFIKTKNRIEVEKEFNDVFNKKVNLRHRTTNLRHIKSVLDRDRMIKYIKKEQQNKIKCLYWN